MSKNLSAALVVSFDCRQNFLLLENFCLERKPTRLAVPWKKAEEVTRKNWKMGVANKDLENEKAG